MKPIQTNRKIKLLLENNVQLLYVVIGKMPVGYLAVEIDDINFNVGKSIEEIDEKMKLLQENGNKVHVLPNYFLEEDLWLADDDDLNLSIFDLINFHPTDEEIDNFYKQQKNENTIN